MGLRRFVTVSAVAAASALALTACGLDAKPAPTVTSTVSSQEVVTKTVTKTSTKSPSKSTTSSKTTSSTETTESPINSEAQAFLDYPNDPMPAPEPEPAPQPAPAPAPAAVPDSGGSAYYPNCAAARAAGAAPLYAGQPGYRAALDRDKDGVACE